MNDYGEPKPCCYFHPKEVVVGICALCLKERLLVLASKQGHLTKGSRRSLRALKRKPIITLPKVFALGSFIHLLEPHHHSNRDHSDDEDAIASLEDDSFISIKFEDDGRASWNNKKAKSIEPCTNTTIGKETKEARTVVEHSNHRAVLQWRKRISHLLQLGLRKLSSEASTCHVGFGGKVEGVKGRRGWIWSLRRTTTTTE